jgi:L-asparagine oxygenase
MSIVPETPVETPTKVETFDLNPEDSARMLDVALRFPGAGVYADNFEDRGEALQHTKEVDNLIANSKLGEKLKDLKEGKIVALIVQGLPTDPTLPPAPLDGKAPVGKKTFVSEAVILGMADNLGEPGLLLGEKNEMLLHPITPVPGSENTQSNEGAVELGFHQDLAPDPEIPYRQYHLDMPEYLILNGVQAGSGSTDTYISPIDDALVHLNSQVQEILKQDRFVTNPPDSFVKAVGPTKPPIHPVLIEHEGHMESAVDYSSGLRPSDPNDQEAKEALDQLRQALYKVRQSVRIKPGTAVAFNNRRIVHGRGPVDVDSEHLAQKRWLVRSYVFDSIRMAHQIMGNPSVYLQIGAGLVRVAPSQSQESAKILEMAGREN